MKVTRILVVDDHPVMRHGVAQLLSATPDLEVCAEAGSREEALRLAQKTPPDLAIVDISLGDDRASGLDLIRDLHARLGRVPVLVVSMHDEALYAERALRAGARGYLMKQEPVREILKAVRVVRDGGVYVSPAMREALFRRHAGEPASLAGDSLLSLLSRREFEVFRLLGRGAPSREIARALCLSVKTVETHKLNVRKKLGFSSMSEVVRFAVAWAGRQ